MSHFGVHQNQINFAHTHDEQTTTNTHQVQEDVAITTQTGASNVQTGLQLHHPLFLRLKADI